MRTLAICWVAILTLPSPVQVESCVHSIGEASEAKADPGCSHPLMHPKSSPLENLPCVLRVGARGTLSVGSSAACLAAALSPMKVLWGKKEMACYNGLAVGQVFSYFWVKAAV